jgi:hypothetical protein
VTLIGSGELSPSMGKVHRAVIARIAGPVHAVFVDTPAGFELNADLISAGAMEYFERHLSLDLSVASFKAAAAATPGHLESALVELQHANYVLAGPGSPTYAVRNWRDTPIIDTIARRLATGAHLVFASAAAIAVGRHVLPVYEIYKVGEEPRWVDGLDLLVPYGLELAIVPHWNNREGSTHDTRYCFMGEPRMRFLERLLPASATILGVDEHTACILDLDRGECLVMGAGHATVRKKSREDVRHPAGSSFALDELRATPSATDRLIERAATDENQVPSWLDWPEVEEEESGDVVPFVELLVDVRTRLREEKQYALADEIRRRLAEVGIALQDSPAGTTWKEKRR